MSDFFSIVLSSSPSLGIITQIMYRFASYYRQRILLRELVNMDVLDLACSESAKKISLKLSLKELLAKMGEM